MMNFAWLSLSLITFSLLLVPHAEAQWQTYPGVLNRGFAPIMLVSEHNISNWVVDPESAKTQHAIQHYCQVVGRYFDRYGWEKKPCKDVHWRADLVSHNGHPLIYAVFGSGKTTTLLLSGVHPDELTPLPMGFRFADYLATHAEKIPANSRIVVAPLVNPDGFVRNKPSRTTAEVLIPIATFSRSIGTNAPRKYGWGERAEVHDTSLVTFPTPRLRLSFKCD